MGFGSWSTVITIRPRPWPAVAEGIVNRGQHARVLCFDIGDREQCSQVLGADLEQNGPYYWGRLQRRNRKG